METNMDDILQFRADQLTFEASDDEYVTHVFLHSTTAAEKRYLMINRSVDPRNKSGVFLEYNDQTRVAEGGIKKCQLQADRLIVDIGEGVAKSLGVPGVNQIVVDFDATHISLPKLSEALAAIFADSAEYVDGSQA